MSSKNSSGFLADSSYRPNDQYRSTIFSTIVTSPDEQNRKLKFKLNNSSQASQESIQYLSPENSKSKAKIQLQSDKSLVDMYKSMPRQKPRYDEESKYLKKFHYAKSPSRIKCPDIGKPVYIYDTLSFRQRSNMTFVDIKNQSPSVLENQGSHVFTKQFKSRNR